VAIAPPSQYPSAPSPTSRSWRGVGRGVGHAELEGSGGLLVGDGAIATVDIHIVTVVS
jgi:hypothetical protein